MKREPQALGQTEVVIPFRQLLCGSTLDVGLRVSDTPRVERIEHPPILKSETDTVEAVASAFRLGGTKPAEEDHRRDELLVGADAKCVSAGLRAVVPSVPESVIPLAQGWWPRHVSTFGQR